MKRDAVSRHRGKLTPAFMRPQLITWKSREPLDADFKLRSVFPRVSGLAFGSCENVSAIAEKAAVFAGTAVHLHVFPRVVPGDGLDENEWTQLHATEAAIRTGLDAAGVTLHKARIPRDGEWVLDVILEEEGKPMFVGVHQHTYASHPNAGGLSHIILPEDAPSRAYLKMEQALAWAGLDGEGKLSGKTAIELGCSPGGASYALLRRGVNVIGVDTAKVSKVVSDFKGKTGARFTHLECAVGQLPEQELPRRMDILVSDMNIAPPVALRYIERVQHRLQAKVLILTLKINDVIIEKSVGSFIKQIESFAPAPVRAMQLPANRSEFCVLAGKF
jgi:23S rRNA (cytidine2498-2'-O)-methyltransferase